MTDPNMTNMTEKIKQVLIVRRNYYDKNGQKFGMRLGKIVAQACHASNGAAFLFNGVYYDEKLRVPIKQTEEEWYFEKYTKATVQVKEEAELFDIRDKAKAANLPYFLVCDEGVTEFNGIPTYTVLAIGPALASEIDKITGHLELL